MTYFDHFAEPQTTAIGDWLVQRRTEREFSLIQPYLHNKQTRVLEIGAGKGQLAECFLTAGYRNFVAIEPHDGMRRILERKGIVARNYVVPPLLEEDGTCGAIVSTDVFEHLRDIEQARDVLCEARRVLQPGGVLVIAAPDYLHWREDFFNADFSHSYITSVRRMMQLLFDHGFRTARYTYLSAFFTGAPATPISHFARLVLFFPIGNQVDSKLYKLKLTFLRRFLIIGIKQTNDDSR